MGVGRTVACYGQGLLGSTTDDYHQHSQATASLAYPRLRLKPFLASMPTPLHHSRLRCTEGHLAVDRVVLNALGLGLQSSSLLLAPDQKDALSLVGGRRLADPHLGFCRE